MLTYIERPKKNQYPEICTPGPMISFHYIAVIDQWAIERYPLPPKACPSERRIIRRMRERYREKIVHKLMSDAGYVMPIKPTTT